MKIVENCFYRLIIKHEQLCCIVDNPLPRVYNLTGKLLQEKFSTYQRHIIPLLFYFFF